MTSIQHTFLTSDSQRSNNSESASIVSDLSSLNSIRRLGQTDEVAAIKQVAKEFEGFFLNMMLKSMRAASEVIGDDSPLSSNDQKLYVGLLDEQMANNLAGKGSLGIAGLLTEQMLRLKGQAGSESVPVSQPHSGTTLAVALNDPLHKKMPMPIAKEESKVTKEIERPLSPDNAASNRVIEPQVPVAVAKAKASRQTLFESAEAFVEGLIPYAKKAARLLNTDPKVVLAQAALETGWGQFVMHDSRGQSGFNLFGIKANNDWRGGKIETASLEVEQGQFSPVVSEFRSYQNYAEAFDDYVKFLVSNPRYEKVLSSENPEGFAKALQDAGYATDPDYGSKIMRIFHSDLLQKITNDHD